VRASVRGGDGHWMRVRRSCPFSFVRGQDISEEEKRADEKLKSWMAGGKYEESCANPINQSIKSQSRGMSKVKKRVNILLVKRDTFRFLPRVCLNDNMPSVPAEEK